MQFYECDYSYRYLQELYDMLDGKRFVLSMLGVDRFSISVARNRVRVYIISEDKYGAIYITNKIDSVVGAIIFITETASADGRS